MQEATPSTMRTRGNVVRDTYIDTRQDAELRDVYNALKGEIQARGGVAWLSTRTLCGKKLYRGHSRVQELVAELVRRGQVRRVSAPGRGRGRGRTLYWL